MTYGMTTTQVRAELDAELQRQYAMARELRDIDTVLYEPWQVEYWTSDRVRTLRELYKESAAVFCKRLGVSSSAVSNWENMVSRPRIDIIPKLMELDRQVRERA